MREDLTKIRLASYMLLRTELTDNLLLLLATENRFDFREFTDLCFDRRDLFCERSDLTLMTLWIDFQFSETLTHLNQAPSHPLF